ncbi:MAG: hydrogenase expression/formation protein, partial [Acetobacter sp.]|nr:hydrogenase expression/formation protein [Acetobacter sp.]
MIYRLTTPPLGFGTGSMAPKGEDDLQYLVMPSGVRIYEQHVPEMEHLLAKEQEIRPALEYIHALGEAAAAWQPGQNLLLKRDGLNASQNAFINETLGEGEVAIVLEDGTKRLEIQETVFAGVWS